MKSRLAFVMAAALGAAMVCAPAAMTHSRSNRSDVITRMSCGAALCCTRRSMTVSAV